MRLQQKRRHKSRLVQEKWDFIQNIHEQTDSVQTTGLDMNGGTICFYFHYLVSERYALPKRYTIPTTAILISIRTMPRAGAEICGRTVSRLLARWAAKRLLRRINGSIGLNKQDPYSVLWHRVGIEVYFNFLSHF